MTWVDFGVQWKDCLVGLQMLQVHPAANNVKDMISTQNPFSSHP